jgi:hypothetical protein
MNFRINKEIESLKAMGIPETLSAVISLSKNGKIEETNQYLEEMRQENEFLKELLEEQNFKPITSDILKLNNEGEFIQK